MKILLGYSYHKSPVDVGTKKEAWLSRLRSHGFNVEGFSLTLNPPGPPLYWRELDARWKRGDKQLLIFYEKLARKIEDFDVFVNCNGINIHPEFARQLSAFTVFCCFDDPETSEYLSKPVASAFDLCMVGNIACLDMYKSWGVREVRWWPNGFRATDYNPSVTEEQILNGPRDIDISLFCERESHWRDERLDRFVQAFPDGAYYGHGWINGFLPEDEKLKVLSKTKIGPNFHNSIGPVNFRTFILPANGILQICDNKSYLGNIFELGKEVVGFDQIREAIDLCRYYLAHEKERRVIAYQGWMRAHRDYNEVAVFGLLTQAIEEVKKKGNQEKRGAGIYLALKKQRVKGTVRKLLSARPGLRTAIRKTFKKIVG